MAAKSNDKLLNGFLSFQYDPISCGLTLKNYFERWEQIYLKVEDHEFEWFCWTYELFFTGPTRSV